jgi:hypothetical protein
MQRKILLMVFGLSFAFLINGCQDEDPFFPYSSLFKQEAKNQESAVLSTVLDSLNQNKKSGVIYVADSTFAHGITGATMEAIDQRVAYIKEEMPDAEASTLYDFKLKNAESYKVRNSFTTKLPCELVDNSMIYGKVVLSRVGFSKNGTQACVYAGLLEAPLAGAGYYFILAHSNGRWRITSSSMAWIS